MDRSPKALARVARLLAEGPSCQRGEQVIIFRKDDPSRAFWSGCRSYKCLQCAGLKAQRTATTMAWAAEQHDRWRWGTLTNAPEDLAARLQKVRDLGRWSRARGAEWNIAWVTERGSATGMVHIHLLHHGDYVDKAALERRWGAHTWWESHQGDATRWAAYSSKSAAQARAQYASKGTQQLQDWLDLSGGRPWRWSAGYLPHDLVTSMRLAHEEGAEPAEWMRATEGFYRTVVGM